MIFLPLCAWIFGSFSSWRPQAIVVGWEKSIQTTSSSTQSMYGPCTLVLFELYQFENYVPDQICLEVNVSVNSDTIKLSKHGFCFKFQEKSFRPIGFVICLIRPISWDSWFRKSKDTNNQIGCDQP